MYEQLCQKLIEGCYLIKVFIDDELISQGTGFAFLPTGEILTAAHVITGRMPLRLEDVRDPSVRIFGQSPTCPVREYAVGFCGITVRTPGLLQPIDVDVGVLIPKSRSETPLPHLPTKVDYMPQLGQRVLLAGFSDEVALPFGLNRILDRNIPGAADFFRAIKVGYEAQMGNLMIKSAMIGNVRSFEASSSAAKEFARGDLFYMDNTLHSGASGGPVMNAVGEVIGVLTERAITNATTKDQILHVPSGSALAISTRVLLSLNSFQQQ